MAGNLNLSSSSSVSFEVGSGPLAVQLCVQFDGELKVKSWAQLPPLMGKTQLLCGQLTASFQSFFSYLQLFHTNELLFFRFPHFLVHRATFPPSASSLSRSAKLPPIPDQSTGHLSLPSYFHLKTVVPTASQLNPPGLFQVRLTLPSLSSTTSSSSCYNLHLPMFMCFIRSHFWRFYGGGYPHPNSLAGCGGWNGCTAGPSIEKTIISVSRSQLLPDAMT